MKKLLFISCLFSATISFAQNSLEEKSAHIKVGDITAAYLQKSISIHYAVVPLPIKNETSFYNNYSSPVKVKNSIIAQDGTQLFAWASESAVLKLIQNISADVFKKQPANATYLWLITDEKGAPLAQISFSQEDVFPLN